LLALALVLAYRQVVACREVIDIVKNHDYRSGTHVSGGIVDRNSLCSQIYILGLLY
jgi:hypothetical protein